MTKTLVYGSCYIQTEQELANIVLSHKVFRHLNPHLDFILLDSCSPFDPSNVIRGEEIYRFPDNPGHLSRGGGDGAGRSFCEGMTLAINRDYDYCVCWEMDVFFFKPMQPIIDAMAKASVKAAALPQSQYVFPEFGVSFYNVRYLREKNIVGRYDWWNAPNYPIPEMRIFNMLGDDLWLLPLSGMRNDHHQLNSTNLAQAFPYGPCSWLTHCYQDPQTYHRAIEMNGIKLA